ncbi:ParB/RepB/Spo0J family partition protein [Maribacter polysaccharolyticus]|uniref:ParB/RepB/Spo0J family partition protein n=1 Tax=Maribacter polysaccharolyticus TaxID=3020831 RepID=UPI00237EEEEC|nr:ParB/RepB/Spo0J family partition protein [Maribacter polysaccharolyticus]MDE3744014.1 ParB/RepB/Spo0J family partition protein [Maribacter polysaccharolyticus]
MENTSVQELQLTAIKPDPNQPRKTFDEEQLRQLSLSIEKFGVLQPITVRPDKDGHIIVMGERRYRASLLANLKTIPCIVRDFDSTVISEVQIIENLQRQEVEPLEEAEAIAYLLEKYTAEEISHRIGRTLKFIYGRIKLANLIEGFRPFVKSKELTLSLAVKIAMFPKADQEMFLDTMGDGFRSYPVENAISNKMFDLQEAPFQLDDAKLLPDAGPCALCPFNSKNQGNLFGDDKQICTKSSCFTAKKSKTLLQLIEQVKADGTLLVPEIYKYNIDSSHNALVLSIIQENGLIPYILDDLDYIEQPVIPTKEQIEEENHWMDFTKEELEQEFNEAMALYAEELQAFHDAPEKGYLKGLLFNTRTYQVKEVLVLIENETPKEKNSVPIDKKKMDDCTPKEKIQKIKDRELRKKQIEGNKEFEEMVRAIGESDYVNSKKALTQNEMVAFCISLYENTIGYGTKRKFIDGFYGKNQPKDVSKNVQRFKKNFKKDTFNKLIRLLLLQNVHFGESNHTNNLVNNSFYVALKDYCKKEIETIEASYAESLSLREKRLQDRITELEEELSAQKG